MSIKRPPATDEEVAGIITKALLRASHPKVPVSPVEYAADVLSLVARIEADREEIASLHARNSDLMALMRVQEAEKEEEIARLRAEARAYEHYVMTGRSEQHERLVSERDALKAEVERLTPAFLPCHVCGSKGFSDIVNGAVVLCETCHGTGRSKR